MTSLFILKPNMKMPAFSSYILVSGDDAIMVPSRPVTTTQVAPVAALLLLCISVFVSACFCHESLQEERKDCIIHKKYNSKKKAMKKEGKKTNTSK